MIWVKRKGRHFLVERRKETCPRCRKRRRVHSKNGRRQGYCVRCRAAYLRAWARRNRGKWSAYFRKWRLGNLDKRAVDERSYRARRAQVGGRFSIAEWQDMKKKYRHHCARCKKRKPLTIDHVIPLSRGGAHCAENIQPLCSSCNSAKGDRVA
jgi:5-methylcytosine-specific restriction endonuclease McrA